jgi:hypothetical protein
MLGRCLLLFGATSVEAQFAPLHLPVRVHLLHSAESAELSSSYTDQDAAELLATTNVVWRLAGIEWTLESVVRDDVPHGAQFDSVLNGTLTSVPATLASILPTHDRLSPGWNVYIVHNLGQLAGGVYEPEANGVLLAERGRGAVLLPAAAGGITLAHELGHSLGLDHEDCDASHNLMANDCGGVAPEVRSLSPDQVVRARIQAASGTAFAMLAQAATMPTNLGFESPLPGWPAFPAGWYITRERGPDIVRDSVAPFAGRFSLRSEWTKGRPRGANDFTSVAQQYPVDRARGCVVRVAVSVRTEAITSGNANLFLRVVAPDGRNLSFANLGSSAPTGTTPWRRYDVEVVVDTTAYGVLFGVTHAGDGTAWFDSVTVSTTSRGVHSRAQDARECVQDAHFGARN